MSVTRIAGHCRLHNKSPNFLTTRHTGIFLGAYFLRKLEVSTQRFVPKKFPGWILTSSRECDGGLLSGVDEAHQFLAGDGFLHQQELSHLVQQRPRQGQPLDQGRRPLVLAAEQIKRVLSPAQPHLQQILRCLLPAPKAHPLQQGQQLLQQIPPHRHDGPPAQGKPPVLKALHGPAEKGQPRTQGLAAAHRPVADDGLFVPVR